MKKYMIEYAKAYNEPADNYIGDFVEAESLDEALDFAADWLKEHGMDEDEIKSLIPFVKDEDGESYDLNKRYLVIQESRKGDSWTDVYDTLEEANNAAVKTWDGWTKGDRNSNHLYVLDVEAKDCNEDEDGIDWTGWSGGGREFDRFDSLEAGVKTKEYPASVDIWVKGQYVGFSVDGLCVDEELKGDPDTDKETVISNWIDADIERIENRLERCLFFNEKEAVIDFLETVYDCK